MPEVKTDFELQAGPWTLKTPGVYLWLECAYCGWAFGVQGLPVPPLPTPMQSHHAKIICEMCFQKLLLENAPPWFKVATKDIHAKGHRMPLAKSTVTSQKPPRTTPPVTKKPIRKGIEA